MLFVSVSFSALISGWCALYVSCYFIGCRLINKINCRNAFHGKPDGTSIEIQRGHGKMEMYAPDETFTGRELTK
jgi:hypothetical protein